MNNRFSESIVVNSEVRLQFDVHGRHTPMLTVFIPLRFQPNHMKTSTNFIEPRTSKVPGVFQHSTVKTDLRGEQGICINQKKNLLAERLELDCVKTGLCQCSALLPTIPLLIFAISH